MSPIRPYAMAAALLAALAVQARPAAAQQGSALPETRSATPGGQTDVKPAEEVAKGIWDRANLFGDWGGLRTRLADRGFTFGLTETAEVLGNPSGGVRRSVVFDGLLQLGFGIDTQKAFGLPGGTFNVSAYQLHGRGLSLNALGNNFNTVSGIEAERGFLLFELWYEQLFLGDKIGVRVGQLGADQEFVASQYAGLFIQSSFGWPTLLTAALPSGGPVYPLATPGVRVRVRPTPEATVLLGVFNGDPAGPGRGTPQSRDRAGANFRVRDDVLALLEVQYAINQEEGATGKPGTYKLGAFFHNGRFPDQRRTATGESLADVVSQDATGRPRRHNWGAYGIVDQLVWRPEGSKDGGIGVFGRVVGAPGDRNAINLYIDAGVTWKGALPQRPDDTLGLGFAFSRISDTAAKLDSDTAAFAGSALPIRRHESVLELTYQAQIAPWWQVQPTAQYVFNILGGVNDPARPGKRIPDAAVLGLRTSITF